jgi:hypothetical protein
MTSHTKLHKWYYLLFFISPLIAFVTALRKGDTKVFMNVLWLFVIFYGFTITFPYNQTNMDGIRRMENFQTFASITETNWSDFHSYFIDEEAGKFDLFESVLVFAISRFTDDGRVLFMVYGLLFGYFYSRNLGYVFDRITVAVKKKYFYLLIYLAVIIPFWNLGGFRFWFAAHLLLYGLLPYLFEQKKSKLLWIMVTPFVHFSFLFALGIFFLYVLIGQRTLAYFIYFVSTAFLSRVGLPFFKTLVSFVPSVQVQKKTDSYTHEGHIERVESLRSLELNWYVDFYNVFMYWFAIVTLLYCYLYYRRQIKGQLAASFNFTLFFLGTSFLFSTIPSMGRFISIGFVVCFSFFLSLIAENRNSAPLQNYLQWSKWGVYVCVIVSFRMAFDTVSFMSLFTNPLIAPFFSKDNFSMIDLFK